MGSNLSLAKKRFYMRANDDDEEDDIEHHQAVLDSQDLVATISDNTYETLMLMKKAENTISSVNLVKSKISILIRLHKNSLYLHRNARDFTLKFKYDALESVNIKVMAEVYENSVGENKYYTKRNTTCCSIDRGNNKISNITIPFQILSNIHGLLNFSNEISNNSIPFVIEATNANNNSVIQYIQIRLNAKEVPTSKDIIPLESYKTILKMNNSYCVIEEMYGISDIKNSNENADLGLDKKLCSVCFTNVKCIITQPCGHLCLCEKCMKTIYITSQKCPMCRQNIEYSYSVQ